MGRQSSSRRAMRTHNLMQAPVKPVQVKERAVVRDSLDRLAVNL